MLKWVMPEHVPSLEELAAEHNVDIEFLRKFQENVNRSNDAQGRWRAWCSPLLDQARKIEALLRAHPKQRVHALDRPGIMVSQRSQLGEDLQLFIDVPGHPSLSLQFDPFEGISLCGDIVAHNPNSNVFTSTQAIAHLDHSWSHQPSIVQEKWPTPFESVAHVLSCVHDALQNNAPLDNASDWPTVLREYLAKPAQPVDTSARWAHWVQTWGTPEMQSSFHIVQSLFDSAQDSDAWRAQLLASWCPEPVGAAVGSLDASSIALLGQELH